MSYLVIDIGGTALKYARMDREEHFLSHGSIPTPQTGREDLIEAIGRLYDEIPDCEGIAISMPGIIDTETGLVLMGGALKYNNGFHIRDAIAKRCPVPVYVENDAKCAALAEAAEGSLKDVSNGMVLIFGTMIGGALIHDHQLYRGSHFSAGEISYVITDRSGVPTFEGVWGNRCSALALCKMYAEKKGLPLEAVDGRKVFQAVSEGDEDAVSALRDFTYEIAVQIFNFQNLYDPERFAIGGGISAQIVFIESIREHLKTLYEICPYYVRRAEIVPCAFRNDANLLGAFQCFIQNQG